MLANLEERFITTWPKVKDYDVHHDEKESIPSDHNSYDVKVDSVHCDQHLKVKFFSMYLDPTSLKPNNFIMWPVVKPVIRASSKEI
jgi:hypothetical protein